MHLWTRLGFHIAIPLTCALYLAAVPSPAHALTLKTGCPEVLATIGGKLERVLLAIETYNTQHSTDGNKNKKNINAVNAAATDVPKDVESSTLSATAGASLKTLLGKYHSDDNTQAINKTTEVLYRGDATALPSRFDGPHINTTALTTDLNDICDLEIKARRTLTPEKISEIKKFFKDAPFLGADLETKVANVIEACHDTTSNTYSIELRGSATSNPQLQFKVACSGHEAHQKIYNSLLDIRNYLTGKTSQNVDAICQAWNLPGNNSAGLNSTTFGDQKPSAVVPIPLVATVPEDDTHADLRTLAKKCHEVDFGPWYKHGNFVRDFTGSGTDTSSPLRTAIYYANFHDDVSPGIKAANAHRMVGFYADRIGDESGVGMNWLDEEKAKGADFWAWDPEYVFIPKETREFKPGGDWNFTAKDIRTDPDIKFQAALHYLSLRKCVSRREDMRKSDACVEAAKDPKNLPYPFNQVGSNAVHPHVAQGESGEAITGLNTMNYIHRAFACNMRGSATVRSAVYDLKYGWPSTATTRPAQPDTVVKFCTNAERFDEPATNESTVREVSMKGLPNLFAEAAGALRPASGLVAFHELQKVAAAKTPPQALFYMSLNQDKLKPTASDERKWEDYTSDKSEGLDDINFRKVISFFGAEMLFMQQGSDIAVIQEIGKLKRKMAQTSADLRAAIFLPPAPAMSSMVIDGKLMAGYYLNKVRSNWVNEMVNPLYHAYYSGTGGKTAWETVTFQSQKSAFEREDKLVHSAAFKLLMGLDPTHPPIMLNTATGQVLTFLEWGRPLAEDRAEPSDEVAQIPMFLVGDYYKDLPAQGLFPSVGAILGDLTTLAASKNYGLTKSDIFIRKKDKDSDQIDIIPGSAVIGAMQALNMSIAEVIHRECTLQDEGFAQMMGRIRDCKNKPQAVPSPAPVLAATGSPSPATPPSPPDPCLPPPYQAILDSVGGKKPEFDICKAMAVMATHYDTQLKEGIPSCSVKKWVPWTECANKQGPVMKWGMRLIGTAIIIQAIFMILVDDGEKHWFWEWDKWKHTRFNPKKDDDRAAKQAAANITTRTTERRAASERAASTALQNLRSRVPSYSLRSSSSAVRRSRGNVRGTDATKSARGKGKAPASTSKSGRTGTKSLPGLNFRIGPSK